MTDTLVETFYPSKRIQIIHPGPVGPVGDVLCQTRLKHSNPDMALRWEYWNSGVNEIFLGSNVQDGYKRSYVSAGGSARTIERGKRRMVTRKGIRVQDININTNMMEPKVGSLGDYDWRNKQATVYESNRTGFKFLPLPYGYELPYGQIPRAGGLVSRGVTAVPPYNPIFGQKPGQPPITGGGSTKPGVPAPPTGGNPKTLPSDNAPGTQQGKTCQKPIIRNSIYKSV